MKFILLAVLLLLSRVNLSAQQEIIVRSLKAFTGNETDLPVVIDNNLLSIQFDVESDYMPVMNILFRFCNVNWEPTDNLFLLNYGKNIAYNLEFRTLPATIEKARYRFEGRFPDARDMVSFPYSGKWRFYLVAPNDTSIVYGEGKFYVVYPEAEMTASVKRGLLEDKTYFPLSLGRVFQVTADIFLPRELTPAFVSHTEIVENQKTDYPDIIDRKFNTVYRQFYWDADRKMSFTAKDIRPGNEYRQTDLRNINKYIGEIVPADFENRIQLSRFFKEGKKDLNGGSILMNPQNQHAQYLNVRFAIRPPEEVWGDIFLVGSFNNWQLLPEFKMSNNYGVYEKIILLKRGIYDYQFVTASYSGGVIKEPDWITLEGNFYETTNVYHIFVYYNDPEFGGYSRIIGYQQILTNIH